MNKLIYSILIICFVQPLANAEPLLKASSDYRWTFPKDHGSHTDFETEWWYVTGHLTDAGNNIFESLTKYGFQVTFFRRVNLEADNKKSQYYLAHAALSDIGNKNFMHSQRVSDQLLAGASEAELHVWNNDWELKQIGPDQFKAVVYLNYKPLVKLSLDFKMSQDLILHGENGYSKKADCKDCASMYYSMPRLETKAVLFKDEKETKLDGLSWFDHEFFTNILDSEQTGWDWFNLMFKDGSNLMAFALRSENDPRNFVSGTFQKGQSIKQLGKKDLNWIVKNISQMKSGTSYPTEWELSLNNDSSLRQIKSLLEEQEIVSTQGSLPSYWEGAIRSESAIGYFEMTGYDKKLKTK